VLALDLLVSKAIEDENEGLDLSILGSLPAKKKKRNGKASTRTIEEGGGARGNRPRLDGLQTFP
jgi:hypothetical protein